MPREHCTNLGCGLINARPKPDRRALDECEIVGRKLVVARRDPTTVFDLVEEPLDQIAGAVEVEAEADWLVAIAPWRAVGPGAPPGGNGSDPVRIIASVGQQQCFRLQARAKLACESAVVYLSSRQREPDWQDIGIDQRMSLAGQTAP